MYDASADIIRAADAYLKSDPREAIGARETYDLIRSGDHGYQVVDVRAPEDYARGHIEGAINIPFDSIHTDRELARLHPDRTAIVTCYRGHTASQAAMLWNMLGHPAVALRYGMSGWLTDPDIVGIAIPPAQATVADKPTVTDPTPSGRTFSLPVIDGYDSPKEAIQDQVQTYFDRDIPKTISADDVFDELSQGESNLVVVDVRDSASYARGHIRGALNIPLDSMAERVTEVDPAARVIVYSRTGHRGGEAAMILQVLGYEAINLRHGMSGWQADPLRGGEPGYDPADVQPLPTIQATGGVG